MIQRIINLFLIVDRWFNKLSGGNPKATISGRCGYFSMKRKGYWRFAEAIIDWTFRPIDGKNHCMQAYRWEVGQMSQFEYSKGNDFMKFLLMHIILASCPVIAIILRVAVLVEPDIRHKDY